MIKAESYTIKTRADRTDLRVKVVTSMNDELKDIGEEVFKVELASIFKQLDSIDPEILPDALEIYTEGLKND